MNIEDFEKAIRIADVNAIMRLMFETSGPILKRGFRTENDLWDFKQECPSSRGGNAEEWAELARDVLGFYNKKGGVIIFGFNDDYGFCGAKHRLDSKLINDKLKKYLGDSIWVNYSREFIQPDQRYVGILLVPPRGPLIIKFKANAPDSGKKTLFRSGDIAVREGDSTITYKGADAEQYIRNQALPTYGKKYEVDEPYFRILCPEYSTFIERVGPCSEIEKALKDPRSTITAILGIGGMGKTALATWATLRAYERGDFAFVVSITAKDRELTTSGIQGLSPDLSSFEALLDAILDVLQFPEDKSRDIVAKEKSVRDLISDSGGLLYVDNLETVDDKRIIKFLDDLPLGVRAITTSRRSTVRVSVRPIDVGPLSEEEIDRYIKSLGNNNGLSYIREFSKEDRSHIGRSCDGIPLAIRWAILKSRSVEEAIAFSEGISKSGRHGEELLEFSFRRVFDSMTEDERSVVQVLSLFQSPVSTEAILVGSGKGVSGDSKLLDSLDQLINDSLVQRVFDPKLNDYSYTMIPVARVFVYTQVSQAGNLEQKIRRRLSDYYEAVDVDKENRATVREIRQGNGDAGEAILDMAISAESRGDLKGAEELYINALKRSPKNWRAAFRFAEYHKHKTQNVGDALRYYEQAAANAPRIGSDGSRVFREWGLLLRKSGVRDATDLAIEKLEEALMRDKSDEKAAHSLGELYCKKGAFLRAIQVLEPLARHRSWKTREYAYNSLIKAYEGAGQNLNILETKKKISDEGMTLFGSI